MQPSIVTHQPFKALYALYALTFSLLRLPLWLLKFLIPTLRQHPKWSFRQALSVRLITTAVHHFAVLQLETPTPLTPGKEKERFVVVQPAEEGMYVGPMRRDPDVCEGEVGGTWYPAPLTPEGVLAGKGDGRVSVVLHLHGGAYVIGDGRTQATGYLARKLLRHTGASHVFAPQYRLSRLPASKSSNPFPAALQDALTAYLYLRNEVGLRNEDIVLSGDSAGANCAIGLLRYCEEFGGSIGLEGPWFRAVLLWSPWIQPRESVHEAQLLSNKNYGTDFLSSSFTRWGAWALAGLGGEKVLESEYVSFKGKPFRTEVPIWVTTGGAEVLFSDDVEWAEEMRKVGNRVELDVEETAPHDVCYVGGNIGFDAEATACAKRAGEWLKGVRG